MVRSSFFALLSLALVFSSANGQGVSPWLDVGRTVANSFIDILGDFPVPLPNIPTLPAAPAAAPAAPAVAPTPRLITINGRNYITFDYAAPAPPATTTTSRPIVDPLRFYQWLEQARYIATIPPPPATTPHPPHHHGPCHHGCGCAPAPCHGPSCKPEQVRIVVVDDCNDKKSSESCSDESKSDEVDVVVPRKGSKTIHYRVRN